MAIEFDTSTPARALTTLVVLVVALFGCSEPKRVRHGLLDPKKLQKEALERLANVAKDVEIDVDEETRLVNSYDLLDELVERTRRSTSFAAYEGLPEGVLAKTFTNPAAIEIDGYLYYPAPVKLPEKTESAVLKLVADRTTFWPYIAAHPSCGGFHADWCLSWKSDSEMTHMHLCFGCGEVDVYADGNRYIFCNSDDESGLRDLLESSHVNRPRSQD